MSAPARPSTFAAFAKLSASPTEAEASDGAYTYEKHLGKTGAGQGFADVWKFGYFA